VRGAVSSSIVLSFSVFATTTAQPLTAGMAAIPQLDPPYSFQPDVKYLERRIES